MPVTFYHTATPPRKSDRETVEWLTVELGGDNANFDTFVAKYCELFGNDHKESKILNLFRQYAKIEQTAEKGPYATLTLAQKKMYTSMCQTPPQDNESLQKLLHGDTAPRRCREHNCALPHDAPPGQLLCATHADAGRINRCGYVVRCDDEFNITYCDGKVITRAGCYGCQKCNRGLDIATSCETALTRPITSALDESLRRNAESLRSANNFCQGFSSTKDPNHQPSWPTRKRM